MIAADSSSMSAYFRGLSGGDVTAVATALAAGQLVMPSVVVTEIVGAPNGVDIEALLADLPMLEMNDGYWIRAGRTRRLLLAKGFKAKVADTLIAQSCIDHDVALITRDPDFRHFAKHCELQLA